MPESLVLSEEEKMPAVCECDEASLMTPNSWSSQLCEKYMIQASPVLACVRSAVFPDFQVSSARIPECSCVSSTNLKVSLFIEIIFWAATEY
ncbi:uncharacterized protein TNCV_1842911 [Trichonephila clavipes]|nr:uncharacterized protein TNCV_1842911 [Trichonephila clavipes]